MANQAGEEGLGVLGDKSRRAIVLLPELGSPVNQTVTPIRGHSFLVTNLPPLIQLTSGEVILDHAALSDPSARMRSKGSEAGMPKTASTVVTMMRLLRNASSSGICRDDDVHDAQQYVPYQEENSALGSAVALDRSTL